MHLHHNSIKADPADSKGLFSTLRVQRGLPDLLDLDILMFYGSAESSRGHFVKALALENTKAILSSAGSRSTQADRDLLAT